MRSKRSNKLALYLHLVWSTWDRLPLITPRIERRLYRVVESEARQMGCTVLALDGMPDHTHLVVSFPTTLTIATLLMQVKGVSARFANEVLKPQPHFKWQGSYGAFTVCRWDLEKIISYVKRQKLRHRRNDLLPEWEETLEVEPDA